VNDIRILRLAGKSAVEIDDMQSPGARFYPAARHRDRIIGENRIITHIALTQADTLTVFKVNRRNQ
jgi:hypothetical protein